MISNFRIATIIVLFALTYIAMLFFDDIRPTPIMKPLDTLPKQIGQWRLVQKRSLSRSVETMLGMDDYIDYTYANPSGKNIELYVSYFGALGIGGGYHSPQNCLPGGGWNIQTVEKVPIINEYTRSATINKMTVINGGSRQVVYYWYQNRGRIIASEYWDKIYTVIDSILLRRRDGSFIRVISPGMDAETPLAFSQDISNLLNDHLPGRQLSLPKTHSIGGQ